MTVDLKALPEHVLVGLSGGADSVALLLLLLERGGRVEAVHVNHGLRGAESDADEAFVRALCEDQGVPLQVCRAEPPQGESPGEDWARRVRYGFFRQAMAACGAQALVLAHHRDDQAETLLMRLARGTGLSGLAAMAPETDMDGLRVLRPLLGVSRAALREMLVERGQAWREDASNGDPRYLRNALRLEVLPRLERLAPGASARMAGTARLLREDEEALDWLAGRFLQDHDGGRCLPLAALAALPPGLQSRVLRAWWAGEKLPPLSRPQTEALRALLAAPAGQRCNLPGGWHGHRGWTHLHLTPPEPLPGAHGVTLTALPPDGSTGDGRRSQLTPEGWLDGLTLRTWEPGDWIRPYGGPGRKSLQDYFTDRHIDAPFRRRVPLICRGSEALLVGGVGAGDIPTMKHTDQGVLLRWEGRIPWLDDVTKG